MTRELCAPSPDKSPEWRLLEIIACGADRSEAVQELLDDPSFHWGELIEQALRHRMFPIVARRMLDSSLVEYVPRRLQRHLRNTHQVNVRNLQIYQRAVEEIAETFLEEEIGFACTKGIVFETTLYGGRGGRYIRDADFLIQPKSRDTIVTLLEKAGYTRGEYDHDRNDIRPHSRKQLLRFQLNPDHLPEYSRLTGDPLVPVVQFDFSNNMSWVGSEIQIPMNEVLNQVHPVRLTQIGVEIPTLLPEYQFIHTGIHLFREAWLQFSELAPRGDDVNLTKFGDMARLWKKEGSQLTQRLPSIVDRHGLHDILGWVVCHVDSLFGFEINSRLRLGGDESSDFLASVKDGNRVIPLSASMRERLQSRERLGFLGSGGE